MEIHIEQQELLRVVGVALSVVENRNQSLIIGKVCITSKNGVTFIKATNLDCYVTLKPSCVSKKDGGAVFDGRKLLTIISAANKDDAVILHVEDGKMTVSFKRSLVTLKTMSDLDFPSIDIVENEPYSTVLIKEGDLFEGLQKTVFASSQDETRFASLVSVALDFEGDSVSFIATDSYRLALIKKPCENKVGLSGITLVNKVTVLKLLKYLNKTSHSFLQLDISRSRIKTKIGGVEIVCKVIEGKFPSYKKVFPEHIHRFIVNAPELSRAITMMQALNKEKRSSFSIKVSSNMLNISCKNEDGEELTDILDLYKFDHEFETKLNLHLTKEILSHIQSDAAFWHGKEDDPVLIVDEENDSNLFIIMPLIG